MIVNTFYSATRKKTNGVLTKNTADRNAYLYLSPSIAMLHCCDPDGVNISSHIYAGALYFVELKSSVDQLAPQGFNALKRDVFLYEYNYRAEGDEVDEHGVKVVRYDFPTGKYVGAYNAFDSIGRDPQVARMITAEDRQGSEAYDFLFRPSATDRESNFMPFLQGF